MNMCYIKQPQTWKIVTVFTFYMNDLFGDKMCIHIMHEQYVIFSDDLQPVLTLPSLMQTKAHTSCSWLSCLLWLGIPA